MDVNRVLLSMAIVLMIIFVSGMAEAGTGGRLYSKDVICATLAFNAGYDEKGMYYSEKVQPFYATQKEYIHALVQGTHQMVQSVATREGEHPVQVYRDVFDEKCNMPFA